MEDLITKIKSFPSFQLVLSKLLFEALWPDECWHSERILFTVGGTGELELEGQDRCPKCNMLLAKSILANPNLFDSWGGFGRVWEAVKDRKGFEEKFIHLNSPTSYGFIHETYIAFPDFQLEVLKWLNPTGLEEAIREDGGE